MTADTTEKQETMQVTEEPKTVAPETVVAETVAAERPESSEPDNEKSEVIPTSSIEDDDEQVPHLHAKTFLIVFSVCLIYFAQLINVVGAGAVCLNLSPTHKTY
jgi:hypothetical protein